MSSWPFRLFSGRFHVARRLALAPCLLLIVIRLSAQGLPPQWQTLSFAGGYQEHASGYSLHWVSGQTAVRTFGGDGPRLNQGFLQSRLLLVGIVDPTLSVGELRVFPNPVTDHLRLESTFHQPLQLTLYNALGQPLRLALLDGSSLRWDMSNLPSGPYWLAARAAGSRPLQIIKILKIDRS